MVIIARLKALGRSLLATLPTPLPTTDAGLGDWIRAVITLAGQDPSNDSLQHAVASMIMHLPADATRASKARFARQVKRALTQQCAFNVQQDIRNREKAARESMPEQPQV